MKRYHPVALTKAEDYMRRKEVHWYKDTVYIAEDRLTGTFNFATVQVLGKP